ncbi:MAG: GTP-binding protein [Acidimicrobiales bacterium]
MARRPLTLVGGGSELARLVCQLIVPPQLCSVVGSTAALALTQVPAAVGVRIDATTRSIADGPPQIRLAAAIVEAIERFPDTQRVIVVLDEADDVASAAFTILSDEAVRRLVHLDGIVATVDAVQLSTRLMAEQPVDTPQGLDRLAIADRILVARSRDVTPSAFSAVVHVLRSINQTGPILAPAIAPCALDDLLDLDAWSTSPAIGWRPDSASPFLSPDAPSIAVCRVGQPVDSQALDRWLDQVLTDHASRVLRVLGSVSVTSSRRRTFLHGVRSCLVRSHGAAGQLDGRDEQGLVAFVGRQLPADALQRSFASCLQ